MPLSPTNAPEPPKGAPEEAQKPQEAQNTLEAQKTQGALVKKPAGYAISGKWFEALHPAPGLYVVATPIGNLRDITLRALDILAAADEVLCEDTRLSARLLDHYGITTRRTALHEHNERAKSAGIVEKLLHGATLALISDAGTPLLSDPGFPLVRAAREAGVQVFGIPGPSALLGALASVGLPTDQFTFVGFLPPKQAARAKAISQFKERTETLVFYESPRRLEKSLTALAEGLGPDRHAAVAMELTKKFERVHAGTLAELAQLVAESPQRGEAVIVVSGADQTVQIENADWQGALAALMEEQPLRGAVDEISQTYGLKRKQVYSAALALKK